MPAVLLFDVDGDLNVFASVDAAVGWVEAVDVEGGEYPAAYLSDGTVLELTTRDERVVMTPTALRDLPALEDRLARYHSRTGTACDPGSPRDQADAWLQREWEARWPKRPAWLARRLHGDGPQVADDTGGP